MRILGVDYGSKRIGLAISDENASLAFPKTVLLNNDRIMDEIRAIIESESVGKIVVGDPGENTIASAVKTFAERLVEKFGLPVIMENEFMTSLHVSQAGGKKPIARQEKQDRSPKRDDSAAALILQRYLDRK